MNKYQELKSTLLPEVERKIANILNLRVGVGKAMKKNELMNYLPGVHERQVRLAIASLRKKGMLIGSTNSDGYFLCSSMKEYTEMKESEFLARVRDLSETVRIMDVAAKNTFGEGYTPSMF